MITFLRIRRRRDRRWQQGRGRGDGGFALMVVLFVLLLTSLIVTALIGLSFTTAAFSASQETRDQRTRAADAALDATLNQIVRDPTGNLGSSLTKLRAGQTVPDCTIDNNTENFGDPPVAVFVGCEIGPDPALPAAQQRPISGAFAGLLGNEAGRDFVRVVGNEPGGDLGTSWKTGFPWAAALGAGDTPAARAAINGTKATLVHQGAQSLSIAANLDVRRGVAAVRDPVPDTYLTPFDSALSVTGQFRQGDAGLLNGVVVRDTGSETYASGDFSNTCGILQPNALKDPYRNKFAVAARSGGGFMACKQDGGNVVADQGTPEEHTIPTANVADIGPDSPGVMPAAPADWRPKNVAATARSAPTCSGSTITLQPGSYNRLETPKLNQLFDGSCAGRTFIFSPGNYWFDADAAAGNALTFNDPSIKVVFGTPKASLSDASFPEACDPAQPGVSITLSPRISIRHLKGRLAICGKNGPTTPAIYQSSNANLGWIPTPTTVTSPSGGFVNSGSVFAEDGASATYNFDCILWSWGVRNCGTPDISLGGWGADDVPGSAPIESAQVLIRAQKSGLLGWSFLDGTIRYVLKLTTAAGATCQVVGGEVRNDLKLVALDLLDPTLGNCWRVVTDRSQLVNSTLAVSFDIRPGCNLLTCQTYGTLAVDYVALRIPWVPQPTSATQLSGTTLDNVNGVLKANDGQEAALNGVCLPPSLIPLRWEDCPGSMNATFQINQLQDLSNPELSGVADPTSVLTSAYALVRGNVMATSGSSLVINVRQPNIQFGECTVWTSDTPDQGDTRAYNLIGTDLTGNCRDRLTKASQLVGADVRVQVTYNRNAGSCYWLFLCTKWGGSIDYVGLSTTSAAPAPSGGYDTSDTYLGPARPFRVTSDARTTVNAVFGVYGTVSTPRANLEIHWDGPLTGSYSDQPVPGSLVMGSLFSGRGVTALSVGTISSKARATADYATDPVDVGVLCCTVAKPAERLVRLTARVGDQNGPIIGYAEALISDASVGPPVPGAWSGGQKVLIRNWRFCPAATSTTSCPSP